MYRGVAVEGDKVGEEERSKKRVTKQKYRIWLNLKMQNSKRQLVK